MNFSLKKRGFLALSLTVCMCAALLCAFATGVSVAKADETVSGIATGAFNGVNVAWTAAQNENTTAVSYIELRSESSLDLTNAAFVAVRVRHLYSENGKVMRTVLVDKNGKSVGGANGAFTALTAEQLAFFADENMENVTKATGGKQYYNHINIGSFDGWLFLPKDWFAISYTTTYPATTSGSDFDWSNVSGLALGSAYKDIYGLVADFGEVRVYNASPEGKTKDEINAMPYEVLYKPDGTLDNVVANYTDVYRVTPRVAYKDGLLPEEKGGFSAINFKWDERTIGQRQLQAAELRTSADFTNVKYLGIRLQSLNAAAKVLNIRIGAGGKEYIMQSRAAADYNTYTNERGLLYDKSASYETNKATQYYQHVGAFAGFDGWLMLPLEAYPSLTGNAFKSVTSINIGGWMHDFVSQKDAKTYKDAGGCGQNWNIGEIRAYTDLESKNYFTVFVPETGVINQKGYNLKLKRISPISQVETAAGYFDGVAAKWQDAPTESTSAIYKEVAFENDGSVDFTNFSYLALRVYHRASSSSGVLRVRISSGGKDYYLTSRKNADYADNAGELSLLFNPDVTACRTVGGLQYYQHVGAPVGFNGWIFVPASAFGSLGGDSLKTVSRVFVGASVSSSNSTACGQAWDFGEIRVYYDNDLKNMSDYKVFDNPISGLKNNELDASKVTAAEEIALTRSFESNDMGNEYETGSGSFDGLNFDLKTGTKPENSEWYYVDYNNNSFVDFSAFSYLALRMHNNVAMPDDFARDTLQFWLYDGATRKGLSFKGANNLADNERIFLATADFGSITEGYSSGGSFALPYDFDGWLIVPRTAIDGIDSLDQTDVRRIRLYANKAVSNNIDVDMGDLIMFNETTSLDALKEKFGKNEYVTVLSPAVGENKLSADITFSELFDGKNGKITRAVDNKALSARIGNWARLTPGNGTFVRKLQKYGVEGAVMVTKNYFSDVGCTMDGNVPAYLYGQSYLYGKYETGTKAVVETAGEIAVVVPKGEEWNSVREKIAEQGGVLRDTLVYSSWCGVSDTFVVGVSEGETIEYGKGVVVVFGALDSDEEYFSPTDVAPRVITDINDYEVEHLPESRSFVVSSNIVKTAGGRLFSIFGSGGITEPDNRNYTVVVYSDDDGKSWNELMVVDSADVGVNCVGEGLWYFPNGKLVVHVQMGTGVFDARWKMRTWLVTIDNPDAKTVAEMNISDAVDMSDLDLPYGVFGKTMLTRANGEILIWYEDWSGYSTNRPNKNVLVFASDDGGNSWARRGTAVLESDNHVCLEAMIVELSDGTLELYSRSGRADNGLERCVSTDGGATWTNHAVKLPDPLHTPDSRFWMSRLSSGNLIFIANDSLTSRTDMTIWLSEDDGETWAYSYYVEKHIELTSFGVTEDDDGFIYVSYDRGRLSNLEIRGIKLKEADVKAGKLVSEGSRRFCIAKYGIYLDIKGYTDADGNSVDLYRTFEKGTAATDIIATLPTSLKITDDYGRVFDVVGKWTAPADFDAETIGVYVFRFVPDELPALFTDFTGAYDFTETLQVRAAIREFFTVRYLDGETELGSERVADGDVCANVPSTEKEGYSFVGWYLDENFETEADIFAKITADGTLYAKYEKLPDDSSSGSGDSSGGSQSGSSDDDDEGCFSALGGAVSGVALVLFAVALAVMLKKKGVRYEK